LELHLWHFRRRRWALTLDLFFALARDIGIFAHPGELDPGRFSHSFAAARAADQAGHQPEHQQSENCAEQQG
jgi:hypothetical protein